MPIPFTGREFVTWFFIGLVVFLGVSGLVTYDYARDAVGSYITTQSETPYSRCFTEDRSVVYQVRSGNGYEATRTLYDNDGDYLGSSTMDDVGHTYADGEVPRVTDCAYIPGWFFRLWVQ